MTHSQFLAETRLIVENYWRIKASLRLQKPSGTSSDRIRFVGITEIGSMSGLLANESTGQAHTALSDYVENRLARDMFNALIAVFERRVISRIVLGGSEGSGTLGNLLKKVQQIVSIPQMLKEDLVEVRERRNALVHHDGFAGSKYVAAAALVSPRAPDFVPPVIEGTSVIPDGRYLTYASDVLVRYSAAL